MKTMAPSMFLLLVGWFLSPLGYSQSSRSLEDLPPEVLAYPHIILFNGKILTVDAEFSTVEAVAIRGESVLAVGDDDRILKMAGPRTQKIDLEGKTVVPGLIDTHDHLGSYAIAYMALLDKGVQWEGKIETQALVWQDADMALRDIKRAVDAATTGEWVRVFTRTPRPLEDLTMSQLDSISPDTPLVVAQTIQHRPVALNTRAIEWAQIPLDTPGLPRDGSVMISDRAAIRLTQHVMWAIPAEKAIFWQKKTMSLVNSWGLTMVVTRISPDQFNSLREIWLENQLTLRWRVGFPGPVDIPRTGNVSDIGDDWLRISGVWDIAGGSVGFVPGTRAAFSHWTSKVPARAEELLRWPPGRRNLLEALRYGWSVPNSHVHGDIGVRVFLDVIEEAKENPIVKSSNQRFTMDHMEEIADEDIARLKELGVIPSSTMRTIFDDQHPGIGAQSSRYQAVFGADYVNQMLPLKKYLEMGIRPTVEADANDEVLGRPLWTIEKAVCRCVDGSARIWGRDQKVSRQDALRMKTIWAAAYVGDEKKLGSIEPGKLADLVVLDKDYMSVSEDQISELEVILTIVGGKSVYSRN
ncbi:MAG: amidohydrolase family protein [Acidobacteria bacterium]|nr:amidohydrolase family protein [Acidobacteriota bacterium]